MNAVIHKHALLGVRSVIQMRPGAKVLAVGMQNDEIVLWESHGVVSRWIDRIFVAVNTGAVYDNDGEVYIGTVTSSNGIVWHVFEITAADLGSGCAADAKAAASCPPMESAR